MENNYQYLDPEEKYTNSKGVLHNLANIKDERVLVAFESFKVTKRLEELYASQRPQSIKHQTFTIPSASSAQPLFTPC